jgi:hypothetical protein
MVNVSCTAYWQPDKSLYLTSEPQNITVDYLQKLWDFILQHPFKHHRHPPVGHKRQFKNFFNAENAKETQRAPSDYDFNRCPCDLSVFLAIFAFKFLSLISGLIY